MKKNKNISIIIGIIALIIIGGLFYSGLSTIEDEFSNCKYILEGDVCSNYTECYYSQSRDASCIKGYEDKSPDLGEEFYEYDVKSEAVTNLKADATPCNPQQDYDYCWENDDYPSSMIQGYFPAYYYDNGRFYLVKEPTGYICDGDDSYFYNLNLNGFDCNDNSGCDNYLETFPTDVLYYTQVHEYVQSTIKPGFVCHNEGNDDMYTWVGVYFLDSSNNQINYRNVNVQCEHDGQCADNQYCNDYWEYETVCTTLSCSGIIYDHKCYTDTIPTICTSAGKTQPHTCADYLRLYINDIQLDIDYKISEIYSLELTLAEKVDIIDELNVNISDISFAISELELTIQENADYIDELNLSIQETALFIDGLNLTIENQLILIGELELSIQQKEDLIIALELTIKELEDLIAQLQEESDELGLTQSEQEALINELEIKLKEIEDVTFGTDDILNYIKQRELYFIGGLVLVSLLLIWYIYTRKKK